MFVKLKIPTIGKIYGPTKNVFAFFLILETDLHTGTSLFLLSLYRCIALSFCVTCPKIVLLSERNLANAV
jgi:hypothetical protein